MFRSLVSVDLDSPQLFHQLPKIFSDLREWFYGKFSDLWEKRI